MKRVIKIEFTIKNLKFSKILQLKPAYFVITTLFLSALILLFQNQALLLRDCNQDVVQDTIYLDFINSMSESHIQEVAAARGLTMASWEDWQSRYDFLSDTKAQLILNSPLNHSKAASQVIIGKGYDNTQKMMTVILMQHLPIGQYTCFMNQINRAVDEGTIKDPRIAAQALYPDSQLKGTSLYFWWHPIWRNEFSRHSKRFLTQEQIDRVLSGKLWFSTL